MRNTIKKITAMMLATMMFISIIPTSAFAASSDTMRLQDGFYVTTSDVPKEVVEYTQNTVGGMIGDLFDIETVKIGTPFKLSGTDLYYFIVYSNNEIVGTYRVYSTDIGYTGIFSENNDIIDGLKKVKKHTTKETPATVLSGDYDDIYAEVSSSVYNVLEDIKGKKTSDSKLKAHIKVKKGENVIDAAKGIEFAIPTSALAATTTYKYLQVGWAETQTTLPWCMAYVTASIMRYKTGSSLSTISARSVMQYAYPNATSAQLETYHLSTTQATTYAKSKNISPIYTSSTRSYTQVKSDINANSPVAFICDNLNTGAKKSHAFVCRGYDDNNGNSYYSIWNPWYTQFERIYTSNNTYVNAAGTARYKWAATMYNWK